jgi:predicted nucleic acid-binding protein
MSALFRDERGSLIVPAPAIPEIDYLLAKSGVRAAQMTFYRDLVGGKYFVVDLPRESYRRVEELNRQFADLWLGFVDAAVVAISEFVGVRRIAATDRRHFTPLAAALRLELLP